MLTASDVEQKTFSTALRGYDLDEVDDFLDEIVATIKELTEQLDQARAAPGEAPALVTPAPGPEPEPETEIEPEPAAEAPPHHEIDESAIGRALVAAQTAADQLLEDAQNEATRIVDAAMDEADSWSAEREAKRQEAEQEMAALATRVASVRSELSALAGEVSQKLDDMDTVIEGSALAVTAEGDDGEADLLNGEGEESASMEVGDHHGDDTGDETGDNFPGEAASENGESSTNGADHLDDILNGVANDLQLHPGDEETTEGDEDE